MLLKIHVAGANSNTTLVKVKSNVGTRFNCGTYHSNTTLVKVKCETAYYILLNL